MRNVPNMGVFVLVKEEIVINYTLTTRPVR